MGRRSSGAYLSVPLAEKQTIDEHRGASSCADIFPYTQINKIRVLVGKWRADGWPGISSATRQLLEHWSGSGIENQRPFFCQLEAVETIIWLLEARSSARERKAILAELEQTNSNLNSGIPRLAIKMATGTGKTKVMAMLITWLAYRNTRSYKHVVIIAPGLTVKDRLSELDCSSQSESRLPEIYEDLVPPNLTNRISQVKVSVVNFQAFQKRDQLSVDGPSDSASGKERKLLLRGSRNEPDTWREDEEQMLNRLLAKHRNAREIYVFNDEAHHCYAPPEKLAGKADKESKDYEKRAALWFNALLSLNRLGRLKQAIDFSATPMYLRRPVHLTSVIFPWTVSDYPLLEAVEAGLTKIPRVPVSEEVESSSTTEDDVAKGKKKRLPYASKDDEELPVYRNLYKHIEMRFDKTAIDEPPNDLITNLLASMHEHYVTKVEPGYGKIGVVPVMIVVANSIKNAEALYKYIAGYRVPVCKECDKGAKSAVCEKCKKGLVCSQCKVCIACREQQPWIPGRFDLFSNSQADGRNAKRHPPTLLVHSDLDEVIGRSGAKMTSLIDEQLLLFAPDAEQKGEKLKLLRETFNSVGKPGMRGEHIRCVISVSMLTEGWDAKTVTHIFGYRAFSSELLCEQVTGRALRRVSLDPENHENPEFANIFGVPFSFMRADGEAELKPAIQPYIVQSVSDRNPSSRINFPNLVGYRYTNPNSTLVLNSKLIKEYKIDRSTIPRDSRIEGLVGEATTYKSELLRDQQILFRLAARVANKFEGPDKRRRSLFVSALKAVKQWLIGAKIKNEEVKLLQFTPHSEAVPEEIARCCSQKQDSQKLIPIFADEQDRTTMRELNTGNICFRTAKRDVHEALHSELNKAACDSKPEVEVAQALDRNDHVAAWVRNYKLGWRIPYLHAETGIWRSYEPDFIARLHPKPGKKEVINLIIEYKGQPGPDSVAKTKGVESWWIPVVSDSEDDACAGEWRYVFIGPDANIEQALADATRQ